jgi:hypothetical protein
MKKPILAAALLAALFTASALLAYEAGAFAYTKRVETKLLAEPKSQAEVSARISFARKVTIEEVQGAWLRVSDGALSGWVFAGNLAATKPDEGKGLDGVPILASKTTATAAARPLDEAVVEYSKQRNLNDAAADLQWMVDTANAISADDVDQFLQEKKKGEFQ